MKFSILTWSVFLAVSFLFSACQAEQPQRQEEEKSFAIPAVDRSDHHSFARPEEAVIEHLDLNLKVDFIKKQLTGYARYEIDQQEGASEIIFDTRNLQIKKVTLGDREQETDFHLGDPKPFLGRPLHVSLHPDTKVVTIYYATTPGEADALDWLEPQQTAGKEHPFLFTQGQAILTRTWIPIQDSPGIRITYDAEIKVPDELLAVMSASNPREKNKEGRYRFSMEQPIPPYLLALAVGDLRFAPIGSRTGVYAEPPVVEKAAWEFADMERMLSAAENLYGPYLWDRYDVIVLPPSFPFGGMENPRLTFATPTILAGDRSLTALIAHELAHSWSGNLVTNATWNDFWLNEGFTVYFERRIMEELYGEDYADMLAHLGFQDLDHETKALGSDNPDTRLKLDLQGRDPDDGMTDIAYEKGAHFLMRLESLAGRERFDQFLKDYFGKFRFQTVTTEEFLTYLQEHLIGPNNLDIDLKQWVYEPGIPAGIPRTASPKFTEVEHLLDRIMKGTDPSTLPTDGWSTHEWLHFIRLLPEETDAAMMAKLDAAFGFSQSGNAEILAAWFVQSIQHGYEQQIEPEMKAFLVRVGRRKFLTPIYRALKDNGKLETARQIYREARQNYHSVSRGTIDELLEMQI